MKLAARWSLFALMAGFLLEAELIAAEQIPRNSNWRAPISRRTDGPDSELARLRAEVIQKMKDARTSAQKLLEFHEQERKQLNEQYDRRRELYHQGLIARAEVIQAEQAYAQSILRAEEDRRWLAETDMAITEASMRDEVLRLPGLAVGGYSETATLLRYNGAAAWSLADAPKIEKFFQQTFGRALPISALGQTGTHDRLRFDHRDAIDVALHPESKEGQTLLNYLRQVGIPFIAFRSAVAGAATGAHIHIGKPSPRT